MRIVTKDIALTQQQVVSIVRHEYARSVVLWTFTIVSVLVVTSLTLYGFLVRRDYVVLEAWLPFLGFVVLWWVFLVGYLPLSMVKTPLFSRALAVSRLIFTPDSMEQELNDGTSTRVPYLSLRKFRISDKHALLYDQDGMIIVVANTAFVSQEEADKVYSLIRLASRSRSRR